MYECDIKRMEEKITAFGGFGDTGHGGITRFSLSPAAIQARNEIKLRMTRLGLDFKTDDLGDIYCTLPGTDPDAKVIMSGSHCDSVRQGGNYDGILGVLTAMEVIETIVTKKIPHRHPIQLVVWTNEEGALYEPAMMCSGIICGKFKKEEMFASVAKDGSGKTFGQALSESGFLGEEKNRIEPSKTEALVELHIEQGPVLEAGGYDVGVVEGVVGMINYEFTFHGQADHAGTFPMPYRKDALFAASQALLFLHEEFDKIGDKELVYTTGKISCHPNIHTIIPDEVKFTLDVRHQNPEIIKKCVEIIKSMPKEWANCTMSYKEAWARNTVTFHKEWVDDVENAAQKLGYKSHKMYSGAGHDAQYLSEIVPTTMIFVPSKGGHSHCELEYSPVEWCWKGANVLLNTILEIDKK
ncbi:N-carbamoyl-L-amino-acid hydrolase [Treponema berlinense]|uniref:N-carbamoyl-L-amino-acid hydrolase n=1 Tax=Treponema berlinense TaxID=225004 RepID=A0A1T4Q2J2_9SPIR|nr:Zn-dependent hydrolase [Treponema berlinense]MDD5835135.1 Zn-dependent hydrolase [Treponema berlinense]SJZ97731.1 N-carbamoyl-L-amino-acid hydrolase [Treponema berlinense]